MNFQRMSLVRVISPFSSFVRTIFVHVSVPVPSASEWMNECTTAGIQCCVEEEDRKELRINNNSCYLLEYCMNPLLLLLLHGWIFACCCSSSSPDSTVCCCCYCNISFGLGAFLSLLLSPLAHQITRSTIFSVQAYNPSCVVGWSSTSTSSSFSRSPLKHQKCFASFAVSIYNNKQFP